MNIHFENKELFKELKSQSIFNIEIGSRMYGTDNKDSDIDILYIYIPSYDELNSVSSNHHQYQFKEDGIDHIFTDIYTFIKNALNGDSTINFEVINSEKMIGSKLNWLYESRDKFWNYKIVRAYLGRARKDIKTMASFSDVKDKTKKLSHGIRGLFFADAILDKNFKSEISDELKEIFSNIREMTDKKEIGSKANKITTAVSHLRDIINVRLDSLTLELEHYASPSTMLFLDWMIRDMVADFRDNNKESKYFDDLKHLIYDAVSNGIEYENSKIKVK